MCLFVRSLFAVRKTTNKSKKFFLEAPKIFEKIFGFFPVFFVDAVFDAGCFGFSLNESALLEFFKVLRQGGLGYGQVLRQIATVATALARQEGEDVESNGVTQGFCIAGRLVLLGTGNGVKGVFVGVFGHFSVVFWLLSKVSIFFKWLFYSFGCTY